MGEKILSDVIAKPFRDSLVSQIQTLRSEGTEAPLLVGLLANADPAAKKYAEVSDQSLFTYVSNYQLLSPTGSISGPRKLALRTGYARTVFPVCKHLG